MTLRRKSGFCSNATTLWRRQHDNPTGRTHREGVERQELLDARRRGVPEQGRRRLERVAGCNARSDRWAVQSHAAPAEAGQPTGSAAERLQRHQRRADPLLSLSTSRDGAQSKKRPRYSHMNAELALRSASSKDELEDA